MSNSTLNLLLHRTALLACALASVSALAAPKMKLGTLVPDGTSPHKSLMRMAETWRKESGGTADLTIFANGKQGGEAEMVSLMQLNSLQLALLSAVGLAEIELGVTGLQNIPMGFRSLEEVDYVGEKLRPMLEERLAKKGFVVLFWSDAGWVRFFANKPVTRPDDLKKLKLFTWSGSPATVEVYKSAGFNAVPLETADIVPSLQTGLIDAAPAPPFFAMAAQIDTRAPNMVEVNWAPMVGALVIRKETWEKIPADIRLKLLSAATKAGKEIKAASRLESNESVAAMEKRGLKVTKITPEIEAEWRTAAEAVYPKIRGKLVPEDIFDQTMKLLQEYRSQKK
jgi:TRAP-type C4-dicarboxylate transport system substrate-binding protein